MEGKCDELESAFERNDSKTAYRVVKELTNEKSKRVSVIEDACGELLTKTSKIQARWAEYVKELYNFQISTDDSIIETLEEESSGHLEEEPVILRSEVVEAVRNLRSGKAACLDNVSS